MTSLLAWGKRLLGRNRKAASNAARGQPESAAGCQPGQPHASLTISILRVTAHDRPFVLIVEPWADEFAIAVGDECQVVACHPTRSPTFGVEVCRSGDLMVWVNEGGSTYEFSRGGAREFWMPVPIPS
jgi:hypothetical protein